MPPYGEPDWATPGDTSNTGAEQNAGISTTTPATAPTANGSNRSPDENRARMFLVMLSLFNIGLAAMMGALGVVALIEFALDRLSQITDAFLSVYMVIFGALLFLYEIIWWQPFASLNIMFRKNFGFLYGLNGKGLYLIFIAFLTLGLVKDGSATINGLDWATGIGWLTSGFCHIFLSCCIPESNRVYKPPTAGLSQLGQPETPNPV
jgi:hypothetical protein